MQARGVRTGTIAGALLATLLPAAVAAGDDLGALDGAPVSARDSHVPPRGFDGALVLEIERQFAKQDFDTSAIDVAVEHGVVTLTGEVASEAGRRRAEAIVGGMLGVERVVNELRVSPEPPAS